MAFILITREVLHLPIRIFIPNDGNINLIPVRLFYRDSSVYNRKTCSRNILSYNQQ